MSSIRFIVNSLAKKHSNGRFHPESPHRIEVMEKWITSQSNNDITLEYSDEHAKIDEILSTHTIDHYELIEKTKNLDSHFYFTADTAANSYSFDASMQAVHVGKKAVWESSINESIFALTRPPGHHATRFGPQGFCLFNNIAISTELAIQQKKYRRIAIIDFDQHFGNGTAYIHEKNPNILYISTHADPRISYPGCGFYDEIGKEDGRGFNIPIPLGYRASEADLKLAFESLIKPIIYQFKPEFLAISAGFDAYEKDPLGVLGVTQEGFGYIGDQMKEITKSLKIPFANFLEGGYNIDRLSDLLAAYTTSLIDEETEKIRLDPKISPKTETQLIIQKSINLLKDYWSII
ncbi:MAG: histone deacetylase [Candidatus Kariarchaeaceae archaeon]|jgi:acetoin utilization deacetylase AcuC-like enzyme